MSRQVTGRTGLLCLLGSPVAHSISPAMHNEACALLDLDYTYLAFDVAPDRLAEAVEGLKALGVRGFNVTMPHKTAAAALVRASLSGRPHLRGGQHRGQRGRKPGGPHHRWGGLYEERPGGGLSAGGEADGPAGCRRCRHRRPGPGRSGRNGGH